MVTYADEAKVKADLGLVADDDDYAQRSARIADLNETLSRTLDEKCQRTFGGGVITPTVREIGIHGQTVMVLPWAAVSIASITTGGTWDGSGWPGETTLTPADWRPWQQDTAGRIWALERMTGMWDGRYRISAVWADNPGGEVPKDVAALVTYLVTNHDLLFRTSAAGVEGPDANGIRPLNPWSLEISKTLIKKYFLPKVVV